jgi:hypothetical protein
VQSKFDDLQIFEHPNMIALLGRDPFWGRDFPVLRVTAWKSIPSEEMPRFLWEYVSESGFGILEADQEPE